jgi:hypothetical protein
VGVLVDMGVWEATDVGIDAGGEAELNKEALTEDTASGNPAEGVDKAATSSSPAASSLDVQEFMLSMVLRLV